MSRVVFLDAVTGEYAGAAESDHESAAVREAHDRVEQNPSLRLLVCTVLREVYAETRVDVEYDLYPEQLAFAPRPEPVVEDVPAAVGADQPTRPAGPDEEFL